MSIKFLEETMDLMAKYYISIAGEEFLNAKRALFSGEDDVVYNDGIFLDWLICDKNIDYKNITNESNKKFIDAIISSYFSIFEVIEIDGKSFVKDIFTGDDFKLENSDEVNSDTLYAGRIIKFREGKHYLKIFSGYDKELKKVFYSGIMKKYNEWFNEKGAVDIKEFISNESIAIYKFLNIYDTISLNDEEDEDYYVYQIEYIFPDKKLVKGILDKEAEFIEEHDDGMIYRLNVDEVSFVELVLSENKIELETTLEDSIGKCKMKMTEIFGDRIKHLRDVKLFIDDLL